MSRNKCFFRVRISHVLRFISNCDLVTDSPSYNVTWLGRKINELENTKTGMVVAFIDTLSAFNWKD
jgi:hypothetical protein